MAKPLLVDTDMLVDFLRGYPKAVAFVEAHGSRIMLPAIVVAELYSGVKGALDDFVSLFRVVPVDGQLARAAGLCRRDYGKSHGVGLADAILVATAEAQQAELTTLNTKHYPMLRGLRPAYRR